MIVTLCSYIIADAKILLLCLFKIDMPREIKRYARPIYDHNSCTRLVAYKGSSFNNLVHCEIILLRLYCSDHPD